MPEGGVTVKCTTCGHIFKVSKGGEGAEIQETKPVNNANGNWQIKRENGDQLSFKALSTLQKWIMERKVTGADRISRSGDKWTKLADVPEFQVFFQAIGPAPTPEPELPDPELETEANANDEPTSQPAASAPDTAKKEKTKKKKRGLTKKATKKKKKVSKKTLKRKHDTLETTNPGPDGSSEAPKSTTASDQASQNLSDDQPTFLDDDDPIKIWQEQKAKRNTMIGIGISSFMGLLLLASIIDLLVSPSPEPKVADATQLQAGAPQPGMLVRSLPEVLSSDKVSDMNSLLKEIDNLLANSQLDRASQSLLYASKGRLYLAIARMHKEVAHLYYLHAKSLEKLRPKSATEAIQKQNQSLKKSDEYFSKAKIAVAAANDALPEHPLVLLAKADKNAYEGGMDLMRLNIQKARNLGVAYNLDAVVHYEAKVIAILGDSLHSMLKSESRLVKDALSSLHLLLNGKWYQDKRLIYLSLVLGRTENMLRTFPDFARIDRLKEGLDIFVNDHPIHERARVLKIVSLDILPRKQVGANRAATKLEKAVDKLRSLRLRGRQKKAMRKLKALAKKYPREPAPVVELGWANLDVNKPEKALRYFDEAVRIAPVHPMANYGRAEALRFSGKPHQAIEATINSAISSWPRSRSGA